MREYAFVIKNFSPLLSKVTILHSKYGKISCIYGKADQARLLTTGSLIVCTVEHSLHRYTFSYLDIVYTPVMQDIESLEFIHQIMRICWKLLPDKMVVDDIFAFLMEVYKRNDSLLEEHKKLIFLRLFFLLELFEHDLPLYKLAMQNPFDPKIYDSKLIEKYLEIGFHQLFHQNNLEI